MASASQKMPHLPDEMLIIIFGFLAVDGLNYLAPIVKAGPRGVKTALRPQVLKDANISSITCHPSWFQKLHHRNRRIKEEGMHRRIFEKCLDAGNEKAIYYEGLRVVAEESDIEGGIALLTRNVPARDDATLACGFFSMLHGNLDMAGHYLYLFLEYHYQLNTTQTRILGRELFMLLGRYQTARENTYKDTFVYPIAPLIPSPECAKLCLLEHGLYSLNYRDYDMVCNNCGLWWLAKSISEIL